MLDFFRFFALNFVEILRGLTPNLKGNSFLLDWQGAPKLRGRSALRSVFGRSCCSKTAPQSFADRRGMGCKPHRCGNTAKSLRRAAYLWQGVKGDLPPYEQPPCIYRRYARPVKNSLLHSPQSDASVRSNPSSMIEGFSSAICARQKRRRFCYTRTHFFLGWSFGVLDFVK